MDFRLVVYYPTRQIKSISKLFCIEDKIRHNLIQLILRSIQTFTIKNLAPPIKEGVFEMDDWTAWKYHNTFIATLPEKSLVCLI